MATRCLVTRGDLNALVCVKKCWFSFEPPQLRLLKFALRAADPWPLRASQILGWLLSLVSNCKLDRKKMTRKVFSISFLQRRCTRSVVYFYLPSRHSSGSLHFFVIFSKPTCLRCSSLFNAPHCSAVRSFALWLLGYRGTGKISGEEFRY